MLLGDPKWAPNADIATRTHGGDCFPGISVITFSLLLNTESDSLLSTSKSPFSMFNASFASSGLTAHPGHTTNEPKGPGHQVIRRLRWDR